MGKKQGKRCTVNFSYLLDCQVVLVWTTKQSAARAPPASHKKRTMLKLKKLYRLQDRQHMPGIIVVPAMITAASKVSKPETHKASTCQAPQLPAN